MSYDVRATPSALLDLVQQAEYIAAGSLAAADRFAEAVRGWTQTLAKMPGLGAAFHVKNAANASVRISRVPDFPNYLVVYRELPDGIEFVRLFHAATDWQSAFEE